MATWLQSGAYPHPALGRPPSADRANDEANRNGSLAHRSLKPAKHAKRSQAPPKGNENQVSNRMACRRWAPIAMPLPPKHIAC